MIEKPIRKYQKQKDYQKHKILRRIKKRNQRRKEAASKIAERALRKKLKLPAFGAGKDPIHIKPSKRGTFTAAAKKRGMGVQQFANKVLKNPSNYSLAMRKKAQFAKNATKFKH